MASAGLKRNGRLAVSLRAGFTGFTGFTAGSTRRRRKGVFVATGFKHSGDSLGCSVGVGGGMNQYGHREPGFGERAGPSRVLCDPPPRPDIGLSVAVGAATGFFPTSPEACNCNYDSSERDDWRKHVWLRGGKSVARGAPTADPPSSAHSPNKSPDPTRLHTKLSFIRYLQHKKYTLIYGVGQLHYKHAFSETAFGLPISKVPGATSLLTHNTISRMPAPRWKRL